MKAKWKHEYLVSVEHTDCTGVVYHAKYLHFLEMSRMHVLADCCAQHALSVQAFYQSCGFFVVRNVTMHYASPIRLGETLTIKSVAYARSPVRTLWQQQVCVGDRLSAEAQIELVFVGENLKPKKMPLWLAENWTEVE